LSVVFFSSLYGFISGPASGNYSVIPSPKRKMALEKQIDITGLNPVLIWFFLGQKEQMAFERPIGISGLPPVLIRCF